MLPREILAKLHSGLDSSHRELAELLGRDQKTIFNVLHGGEISEPFASFLSRIKSVELSAGEATITLRISRVRDTKRLNVVSR